MPEPAITPPPQAPPAPPPLLMGDDGTVYRAPPDKAAAAIATGKYRPLTPDELVQHQVSKEEEAKGTIGSLQEAGKSALNQLLFGVPGAVTEETESPEEKARREAREEYHKTARVLGGAVGFGGSLLAGGELFKAAELAGQAVSHGILPAEEIAHAALSTKIAAQAANYATQGAALASPQAIVQAAFGDPKKAAETLLWGVGAGAALGGGAELAGAAGRAATEGISKLAGDGKIADALEEYAQKATPTAFGAQRSQTNKLSEDWRQQVVDFAHEQGFIAPGMSKADLADAVKAGHAKFSGQIGETIGALDKALDKGSPEVLGAALKKGQLGDEIRSAFDSAEMRMPMNADQAKALELVASSADQLPTRVVNGQEVVPFEEAQKFVTQLRQKYVKSIGRAENEGGAAGLDVVTPLDRMKSQAYSVVKKALHEAGDGVATAADQPELVGKLVRDKLALAKTAELEKWAANNAAREAGNRTVSLTDFLHMGEGGLAGKLAMANGAGIGAVVGGPTGAIVGGAIGKVAGLPLDYLAKHWMEDKGLIALSALAKRAAKDGPEVFSAVMASEGGKRLAATMQVVQDTVRKLAISGIQDAKARGQEHMASLLGSTTGLTPDQSYSKLGARLTQLGTSPAALAEVTSQLSAPFASTAPQVADEYQQKLAQSIQYLYQALPKAPAPPAPFAPQYWQPSAGDKMAFHDRAEIIANPMIAMRHVAQGTLSDAHLDALRTIYPVVYSMMQNEVLAFSANHPDVKLPLAERQSVAKLLGSSLDSLDTPDRVRQLAAAYAAQPSANASPGQKMPKGKIEHRPSAESTFGATQGPPMESAA